MSVKLDLETMRGDTSEWAITYLVDGVPTSLTGAKLWMTGQRGAGGPTIFQLTSDVNGGITIDPDQVANKGKAKAKLKPESTSGLPSETVVLIYDVQVLIGGDVETLSYGKLTVTPDSTTDIV